MRLNSDQLATFLQQTSSQTGSPQKIVANVFLLTGNEPLQMMQAADAVRAYAKTNEFIERDVLYADASFHWGVLTGVSNSLSLFSEKKLIDLRVETKTPGKAGSQAIREYLENPPEDKILLIQTAKLVGAARNAAWVKAIQKQGVVIQVWELSTPQTMAWISKQIRKNGMRASADAVRLLTERVEGNLLAASQEINKLRLLFDKDDQQQTMIDEEQVLAAVSDSSRFSIFDLASAVMLGDLPRVQHIHHNLKEEGVPIQLILWVLSDLTRQLYSASFNLRNGMHASQIISKIPRPRQKLFQQAMQRMQYANWPDILKKNYDIDRLSKGQGDIANKGLGRVWSELLELALVLAGIEVIVMN